MSAKPIGTLGTIDTLTVGGRTFTDLANLIVLYGACGSNGGSGLFKPNAASAYQVTAGKTLQLWAMRVHQNEANTNGGDHSLNFAYCDNAIAINASTSPTNPVYMYGASTDGLGYGQQVTNPNFLYEVGFRFDIIATKYGYVTSGVASPNFLITVFGYEV